MINLNIKSPDEINGRILRIVCEDKTLVEDVVCSIGHPKPGITQLNLTTMKLILEEYEDLTH